MSGVTLNTKLLLHCDGADTTTTFTDASPSLKGNATVAGNAQVDTGQSVYGGASLQNDGTNGGIRYADSADWDAVAQTGSYTIDFRIKHNGAVGADMSYLAQYANVNNSWILWYDQSEDKMKFTAQEGGGIIISILGNNTVANGSWHHVALIRVLNDYQIYLDGTAIGNAQNEAHTLSLVGSIAFSGIYVENAASWSAGLKGWMDEIRVTTGNPFNADPTNAANTITVPTAAYSIKTGGGIAVGSPHIYKWHKKTYLWVPDRVWYQSNTTKMVR